MENYVLYKFLLAVKNYTLLGYFTSEKVGEKVLNYDPISRNHIGCMPIKDVVKRRVWLL